MISDDLSFCLKCEYGRSDTPNCQDKFFICLKKIPMFDITRPHYKPNATVHNTIGKLQEDGSYKSVGFDQSDKLFTVPDECPFMLERLLK